MDELNTSKINIKENLNKILNEISETAKSCGRNPDEIKLVAVSKFHPVEEIMQAIDAGQVLFGENRVQEACSKFTQIASDGKKFSLHLIGSLQTNKVKQIVPLADCIESVDRLDLLKEIEKQCAKINKNIEVLFEIHTGEDSKAGFQTEEELFQALEYCNQNNAPHIVPRGFMTMAPFTEDETLIRKSFSTLAQLREKYSKIYPNMKLTELSMGMSGDFKIAIEEGSTIVRVGTAIFGERDYSKK